MNKNKPIRKYPKELEERIMEYLRYEDGKLFWKRDILHTAKAGSRAGGLRKNGYRQLYIKKRSIKEHRVVWFIVHGYWPTVIDHINGIKSDNRIENLREATDRENSQNHPRHRNGKLVGATLIKNGLWQSRINFNGKTHILGSFWNEREAHSAYLGALKIVESITSTCSRL